MKRIILVTADVRSSHNIGSLFRTCDGLGVESVYLCGISPRPIGDKNDERLPHIARKADADIHKTALGAELSVPWRYFSSTSEAINNLKQAGWRICALEQTAQSVPVSKYESSKPIALVVGTEVTGLDAAILALCDDYIEIPMNGKKESFNVSVAAAIAMYELLKS